jgi:hypothetical protein
LPQLLALADGDLAPRRRVACTARHAVSAGRTARRMLRKLLKGATCTACGGSLDEHAHRALWIDDRGRPVPHLVCDGCIRGAGDQQALDDLATRCALTLCEPAGRA